MVWVVGAGLMAAEYAKVLNALDVPFTVIGRSEENCRKIADVFNCPFVYGGLQKFLDTNPTPPAKVIVAVGIEALSETTKQLLKFGVKDILVEKPGVGYPSEINELVVLSEKNNATVLLGYNRRFYASVIKAEEIIKNDGGVTSFNFEFTEWAHVIKTLTKAKEELYNWFLGNSTHVIDTAFFLGGSPNQLSTFYKGSLDWHPSSSVFCGAGISKKGALFSYHANWEAPGRWVLEILTRQSRLLFKPMESLQIQLLGSVAVNSVEIDDVLDKQYKPGLYNQTQSFINGEVDRFCTLKEQQEMIEKYYLQMSGYKE